MGRWGLLAVPCTLCDRPRRRRSEKNEGHPFRKGCPSLRLWRFMSVFFIESRLSANWQCLLWIALNQIDTGAS